VILAIRAPRRVTGDHTYRRKLLALRMRLAQGRLLTSGRLVSKTAAV
jgi:hypothetical protein